MGHWLWWTLWIMIAVWRIDDYATSKWPAATWRLIFTCAIAFQGAMNFFWRPKTKLVDVFVILSWVITFSMWLCYCVFWSLDLSANINCETIWIKLYDGFAVSFGFLLFVFMVLQQGGFLGGAYAKMTEKVNPAFIHPADDSGYLDNSHALSDGF